MSAWTCQQLTARPPIRLFHLVFESHGADSEEKHEPVSDIDTAAADGLKVLDPNVWTRRALQEKTVRLGCTVLHQCIRP